MEVVPKMSFAVNDVTSSLTVHTTGKKTFCQNNLHSNFLCPSHQLDVTGSHKPYQPSSKVMKMYWYISNIYKRAFLTAANASHAIASLISNTSGRI